jgi:hypothetical protein
LKTLIDKGIAVVVLTVTRFHRWSASSATYPTAIYTNLDASFTSGDALLDEFFVNVSVAVVV